MFASKPSIKDFALKLPNVAVVMATADACATELAVIERWSEVFRMRRGAQQVTLHLPALPSARPHLTYTRPTYGTTVSLTCSAQDRRRSSFFDF